MKLSYLILSTFCTINFSEYHVRRHIRNGLSEIKIKVSLVLVDCLIWIDRSKQNQFSPKTEDGWFQALTCHLFPSLRPVLDFKYYTVIPIVHICH
jgi:hypothetical protein